MWQQQQQQGGGGGAVVHVDSEDADTPKWHPPGVSGDGGALGEAPGSPGMPPFLGQLPSLASFTNRNPFKAGASSPAASPDGGKGQQRQQRSPEHLRPPEQQLPSASSVTFPRVRGPPSRQS
jgi:hypothetical protein